MNVLWPLFILSLISAFLAVVLRRGYDLGQTDGFVFQKQVVLEAADW